MIVNVCPAATSKAPPDRFWAVVTATERFGEWTDARVDAVEPPGPAQPGQKVRMSHPRFRRLAFTIDVTGLDPQHRWIDLVARFPFGIVNYEHLTLAETPEGGTLVRFN